MVPAFIAYTRGSELERVSNTYTRTHEGRGRSVINAQMSRNNSGGRPGRPRKLARAPRNNGPRVISAGARVCAACTRARIADVENTAGREGNDEGGGRRKIREINEKNSRGKGRMPPRAVVFVAHYGRQNYYCERSNAFCKRRRLVALPVTLRGWRIYVRMRFALGARENQRARRGFAVKIIKRYFTLVRMFVVFCFYFFTRNEIMLIGFNQSSVHEATIVQRSKLREIRFIEIHGTMRTHQARMAVNNE